MTQRFTLTLILLAICYCISPVTAKPLHIITFHSPPYSMELNKQQFGLTTNTVKSMLSYLKLDLPISTYPLERGMRIANQTANVLLYPVERNPQNEQQFHWIGRISQPSAGLFRLQSRTDIQLSSMAEAKQYTVGVTRGSALARKLKQAGFSRLYEVTTDTQALLMLEKQRIDLIASDELILYHLIDIHNRTTNQNLNLKNFHKALALPEDSSAFYIAMSKQTPTETVASFQTAFSYIRGTGKRIEVAHWWTNPAERPQLTVFKRALRQAGYEWVDYTFEGGAGENMTQIIDSYMGSERTPQAIQSYTAQMKYRWGANNTLLKLDEIAIKANWKKHLPKLLHDGIKHNNHYLAVPVNLQRVNWMWLNPQVFKAAGAELPDSWPSLFSALEKIKQTGITPISIGSYPWQEGTLFELLVLGIGGSQFYQQALIELQPTALSSPTMLEVLTSLRRLRDYSNYQQKNQDWVKATERVIQGEAAIYMMGDWAKAVFHNHSIPYGREGYLCLPVPGTQNLFLANIDNFVFPQAGDTNQQGQKVLAELMMSRPVQEAFNLAKGSIPARLDIPRDRFDECSRISMQVASDGELLPSFNFHQIHPEALHNQILAPINRFFRSDTPAEQVMQEFVKIATDYRQRNNR